MGALQGSVHRLDHPFAEMVPALRQSVQLALVLRARDFRQPLFPPLEQKCEAWKAILARCENVPRRPALQSDMSLFPPPHENADEKSRLAYFFQREDGRDGDNATPVERRE